MLSYHIDCQQDDGSWLAHEFSSVDDDLAISHALRVRTANRCELFQAGRWVATFDRPPQLLSHRVTPANDNKQPREAAELCWREAGGAGARRVRLWGY